jgi:DNA-binding CsgD family transcriptional regulator
VNGIILFIYMLAFALGCMTLALAVVYQIQKPHSWTQLFIVCISSLMGCMMLSALQMIASVFMKSDFAKRIVSIIIQSILTANVVFLVSFIPYFITWVIGHPWRNPYKTFFFTLSGVYLVSGVLNIIRPKIVYSNLMEILFVVVIGFCLIVLTKNLNSIEEKDVRAVCITIMIVSVAMLPAIGATLVFPKVRTLMYGIYFLAFSITVMSYLFVYFAQTGKEAKAGRNKELSLQDLSEYHITERELAIIKLISRGLTNKEIAADLDISVNTVNNHVANIFAKTKVRSRIDLLNLLKQPW